jgi:Secretion system C-terminal sorting domain
MQHYFVRQFIVFIFGFFVCITLHAQPSEVIPIAKGMLPNSYPIHGSDLLWKQELEIRKFVAQHPEALQSSSLHKTAWTFGVGSTKSWYADNLITGLTSDRYQVPSTCRAVGANCYIFVEDSSWGTRVNQAAVDSIQIYFDSKTPANPSMGIFATDTSAFGSPPDVDNDPKIIILLLNIKDGYSGSGGYVAGYFQPFNEISPSQRGYSTSNFAEMFYIDTNPLNLTTAGGLSTGISTLAHEFQHMIHFIHDPYEILFVNEGCSVLAEVNCGFPIYDPVLYANEPNHYLLDWRSGDLTHVLNDYSRAARFFVYLRDQAGIGVFKNIVASTQHGTAGIDAGLQAYGSPLRFDGILQDWFIANILDDRSVDSLFGYSYPNLPKPVEHTFYNPNVSLTTDTVQNYAVEYLAFKGGSQLHTTFTSSNSALIIKAVEIGASSKRVLDVTKNVEFTEPSFGTTYYEIHFVVMNTDPNTQAIYSYTASGTGGMSQTILSYAGSATYSILIPGPTSNQKLAERFSPAVSGQLYSVSVELNAIQGSGKLRVSACQDTSGSIGGIPGTRIGASVDIPFSQLVSNSWNEITMQGANVPITAGTDFQIVAEVIGSVGDTLQFLLDNGIPATNRTSSYRIGVNGLGWYNRADPNYSSGRTPTQENLLLTASIAVPTAVIETPPQPNVPRQFELAQNYPNPFNPVTTIKFQLPSKEFVTLKVYDIIGREVATLVDGLKDAGSHDVKFDASNLPSGVYLYRITAGTYIETKKLVLIK